MKKLSLAVDNIKKLKLTSKFDKQISKKTLSLLSKLILLWEEKHNLFANLSDFSIYYSFIAYYSCPPMSALIKKKIK